MNIYIFSEHLFCYIFWNIFSVAAWFLGDIPTQIVFLKSPQNIAYGKLTVHTPNANI